MKIAKPSGTFFSGGIIEARLEPIHGRGVCRVAPHLRDHLGRRQHGFDPRWRFVEFSRLGGNSFGIELQIIAVVGHHSVDFDFLIGNLRVAGPTQPEPLHRRQLANQAEVAFGEIGFVLASAAVAVPPVGLPLVALDAPADSAELTQDNRPIFLGLRQNLWVNWEEMRTKGSVCWNGGQPPNPRGLSHCAKSEVGGEAEEGGSRAALNRPTSLLDLARRSGCSSAEPYPPARYHQYSEEKMVWK